jgi:hypothetical protein
VVQQRDKDIADEAALYAEGQDRVRARREALAEMERRVKQMQDENAEFELKIVARSRGIGKQRDEYITAQAKLAEFQDEVRDRVSLYHAHTLSRNLSHSLSFSLSLTHLSHSHSLC